MYCLPFNHANGTLSLLDDSGPKWIEHPTLGSQADMVAVLANGQGLAAERVYRPHEAAVATPGMSIGGATGYNVPYGPSDIVSVVGFPMGKQAGDGLPIWVTGFVATEPSYSFNQQPVFLISCRTKPGLSGSPVILYSPDSSKARTPYGGTVNLGQPTEVIQLLGLYSGRLDDESDLGCVWNVSAIEALIDSIGPPKIYTMSTAYSF
jgi:hypothetical protein